jgi:isopenicillin N synthase-like dioxygenase
MTILATDSSPGLQIYQNDSWQDVPAIPDTFIINLGDMLERWTNGRFKSTLHRVVSTSGKPRLSCACFFDPDFDTLVECLPTCLAPGEKPKYGPTTSGAHLVSRYAAVQPGFVKPAVAA